MPDRNDVWPTVHQVLDRGGDPREDARVHAHLIEHPEDFGAIERMTSRLEGVREVFGTSSVEPQRDAFGSSTDARSRGSLSRRRVASIASALLISAAACWWVWPQTETVWTSPLPPGPMSGLTLDAGSPPAPLAVHEPDMPGAVPPATALAPTLPGLVLSWSLESSRSDASGTRRHVAHAAGDEMHHGAAANSPSAPSPPGRTLASHVRSHTWSRF